MKNLLLISNSTNPGEPYLGWPREAIKEFLDSHNVKNVLFIPFAGVTISWDDYETRVANVFKELGFNLKSVHHEKNPIKAVVEAEAIAVGGGNTFCLVNELQKQGLMQAIQEKALAGTPYMGWSAGSNVACPTLKTTNDMPIAEPVSFNCMNLIPFQINPHYLDTHPEGHGGETREERILEFLAANQQVVVAGLREASYLLVKGDKMILKGRKSLRLFKYNQESVEYAPETDLSFLLS